MSLGERSCKMYGNCTNVSEENKCTVNCGFYHPVEGVPQDTKLEESKEKPIEIKKDDPILTLSQLPKFDKELEFVVMKRHIFYMQSISPKKIILKYKRKLKDTDKLPDGIYCFHDRENNKLNVKSVFSTFDRDETAKRKAKEAKEKKISEKAD